MRGVVSAVYPATENDGAFFEAEGLCFFEVFEDVGVCESDVNLVTDSASSLLWG